MRFTGSEYYTGNAGKRNAIAVSLLLAVFIGFFGSCTTRRQVTYFSDVKHDTIALALSRYEMKIGKNDILQITISALSETDTRTLNAGVTTAVTGNLPGYLVDEQGNVHIAQIGTIKAEGLTKSELTTVIKDAILKGQFAKEPIVSVRILNYKITVLGEVNRPGVIPVPSEHITFPEALGSAGDLTVYGRRDDVLLIREYNGKQVTQHISLNTNQMFDPEIYNLRNQDVIYVKPNSYRANSANRVSQILPMVFSSFSVLMVVYLQFFK